jgi:hypothetical protein
VILPPPPHADAFLATIVRCDHSLLEVTTSFTINRFKVQIVRILFVFVVYCYSSSLRKLLLPRSREDNDHDGTVRSRKETLDQVEDDSEDNCLSIAFHNFTYVLS